MDERPDRAKAYRERAAEVRSVAQTLKDPGSRRLLAAVADDYERMAASLERPTRHMPRAMATPEEAARRVLLLFVETFRRTPGQPLRLQNLHPHFLVDGWTISDLHAGIVFAVNNGWLELNNGDGMLTPSGFQSV